MLCCAQGAHECLNSAWGARNVNAVDKAEVGLTWLVSMQKAPLAASAFFAKSRKKSIAACTKNVLFSAEQCLAKAAHYTACTMCPGQLA